MEKENIIVIFGGKSTEHDISIITGLQTFTNVDRDKFNVIPVYIYRTGEMFTGNKLGELESYAKFDKDDKQIKKVSFVPGNSFLFVSKNHPNIINKKNFKKPSFINDKSKFKKFLKVDCAVICCHGMNGEDGTLQGLLELSNIPYTSSGVLSSSVTMDKIIMKDIFVANNIETAKYIYFNKYEYILNSNEILKNIETKLNYPMFVKPSNLGSSIGISKCKNREELDDAIEIAYNYDSRILVEEAILNNVEANCAILGNADYQIVSKIEYPKSWSEFLNFDEKYIQRNKSVNLAEKKKEEKKQKLPDEVEENIKLVAQNAFKIFNCSGVVRIDFLIDKETKKVYLNELNSIPGSLAFYLFKDKKFDFKILLNRLIDIAKKERERKDGNKFSYESQALANFGKSSKLNK